MSVHRSTNLHPKPNKQVTACVENNEPRVGNLGCCKSCRGDGVEKIITRRNDEGRRSDFSKARRLCICDAVDGEPAKPPRQRFYVLNYLHDAPALSSRACSEEFWRHPNKMHKQ